MPESYQIYLWLFRYCKVVWMQNILLTTNSYMNSTACLCLLAYHNRGFWSSIFVKSSKIVINARCTLPIVHHVFETTKLVEAYSKSLLPHTESESWEGKRKSWIYAFKDLKNSTNSYLRLINLSIFAAQTKINRFVWNACGAGIMQTTNKTI